MMNVMVYFECYVSRKDNRAFVCKIRGDECNIKGLEG